MTKSLLSIIALILLGAPWTEASAQTQGEMNQDAASEFKAADKELNSIYQRLLEDYADDEAFI
ncbi:MAG: lysozyme inhibitor LprI family protein, partial [Chthoniobacterales bacterium]